MDDLQALTRDRILKALATDTNYLGWWTVPQDGGWVPQPACGIDDTRAVNMVIPGASVSIDGLAGMDGGRYSSTQRRKQQSFNIFVDHWLLEDIDLTNEVVAATLAQWPMIIPPTQTENLGEILDVLMDSLNDWDYLQAVRSPVIRQRSGTGDFRMARAVIRAIGFVYGEWDAIA
jgi:hypothetical protein